MNLPGEPDDSGVLRERLREVEEALDAIRHGDVDAVVMLTRAGDLLYCNSSFAELVGSESTKVIGGSLRRFIADGQWPAVLALIQAEKKSDLEIKGTAGNSIPVHISFSALNGGSLADAEIYCCIVTDLTEQRRVNDQLRLSHEALLRQAAEDERTERLLRQSQKMEAVGQLTGGIAHDFNNLLMVIIGGLSVLNRDPTPERRAKVQDNMRQAAERGAALTRKLLAFSRQKELFAMPTAIPRHVESMRELLDRSLNGDLTVETRFDPDVWPVHVDEGELETALLNLCVNARDAMPNGGVVTIAARNRPNLAEFQLEGDFVELSVADTGMGMAQGTIARCLEPFFTTKEVGKGSGLGLAQVYGFVQGSGGSIQIESRLGDGTRVSLFLPRSRTEARTPTQLPASFLKALPRCTVLLVEDDVAVAALTGEMLQELGYQVMHVHSGQEGLTVLAERHQSIGLILSDVMMPGGMDGVSFFRELRSEGIQLPVVLASGYAESIRLDAERAGIVLLAKPYRIEDLGRALASVLFRYGVMSTATPVS